MSLSRMLKLGQISGLCGPQNLTKGLNLSRSTQKHNVRNFKRGRNQPEEPKVNPSSIETPFQSGSLDPANLTIGKLWKPFAFTVGFSVTCFMGAAVWEYESMRSHAIKMLKKPIKLFKKGTDEFHRHSNSIRKQVEDQWKALTPGQKVFAPICAINILVFAAWRVPRLQPIMLKYFCSNPGSKYVYLPMVLSTFSHYSAFHLFANMYVLHSFSTGAVHSLGKEQFLALYLGAGVISSFTSYVYKIITKQPGLSLGASGAIMAILGYVCTQYPDTQLGIILLPFFTFSAGHAIKGIIALDTAGVVMGWKFFDHAAHLGGAVTGIVWALWGTQKIWPKREPILHYWHEFRGSIK